MGGGVPPNPASRYLSSMGVVDLARFDDTILVNSSCSLGSMVTPIPSILDLVPNPPGQLADS
eukprot:5223176-Prorocentrum_lima.AAC.1